MRTLSTAFAAFVISFVVALSARADDLTMMVERDLSILGYDVGQADGTADVQTAIAISQFQAENNMQVTGEVSPQLAGVLAARLSNPQSAPAPAMAAAPAAGPAVAPAPDPAALKAAQQACLEQKMKEAEAAKQKKKGFGKLFNAVAKVAHKTGNYDMLATTQDLYDANATAADVASAAKDLGLTESDIEACKNP